MGAGQPAGGSPSARPRRHSKAQPTFPAPRTLTSTGQGMGNFAGCGPVGDRGPESPGPRVQVPQLAPCRNGTTGRQGRPDRASLLSRVGLEL